MAKSSKKLKIGHVQDTPMSTSMISNVCMICHMKVHIVNYNLDQKKMPKSKIHILPYYERTDLKTALVHTQRKWLCFVNRQSTEQLDFVLLGFWSRGGPPLLFLPDDRNHICRNPLMVSTPSGLW